jgi:hypothetical protein
MPASSPRARWAKRIRAASRKTVESMIQTGKLLVEAKAKLKHGEFIAMLRSDLPFGPRTAQRLMRIARNPAISKASNWSHLPEALSTLSDLAALSPKTVNLKVASGEINPGTTRAQLRVETPRERPSAPLTSEETHEALLRANKNRVVEAVLDLRRINSAPDEIARALLAGRFAGRWNDDSKAGLDRAVELLMEIQAEIERIERIEYSEREQARQVVVPLRPSSRPPDVPPL